MPEYLFQKCGELGLLGAHMPEVYGGMNLDFNTNTLLCDALGNMGSFNTSFAAHIGIGMLPILYYGTDAQKEKYLPGMIEGRIKASYCLTEPGSGSDAAALKTKAERDGNQWHAACHVSCAWFHGNAACFEEAGAGAMLATALARGELRAIAVATPATVRHGAPALGEHSTAVLREAGFAAAEIEALVAAAVVM